jgi:SAM-dependent methyltransferase
MGIDINRFYQLKNTKKEFSLSGLVGTLGVQNLHSDFIKNKKFTKNLFLKNNSGIFLQLGFHGEESIDANDYEGCDHIFDLNQKDLPKALINRFDVLYNGGTLEHVFDIATALQNCFKMLKVGGTIIHAGPTNGWIDHGFYQFSPTLFNDYYSVNQFEFLESKLLQRNSLDNFVIVHKYIPGSFDHIPDGLNNGCWNYYGVFRKNENSTSSKIPQQRLYNEIYGALKDNISLPQLSYEPPKRFLNGILIEEKNKKNYIFKPTKGLGHEYWVNIPDFAECADGSHGNLSPLLLYEDDIPLGPPHSLHKDIRNLGLGRFSHWNSRLYFSTSDNLPARNRNYYFTLPSTI